ncbi:MAG: regulatory protein [Hyphomicrobiaceae bacterium]|jgi:regulatory protein
MPSPRPRRRPLAPSRKTEPVIVADGASCAAQDRVLDRAKTLLARRAWATGELAERLERDFDPDNVRSVIARLTDLSLLDDTIFAADYAARRAQKGRIGAERICAELAERGVDAATASQAVASLDGESEVVRAREVLARFLSGRPSNDPRAGSAAARHLLRRGYRDDLVAHLLRDLLDGS